MIVTLNNLLLNLSGDGKTVAKMVDVPIHYSSNLSLFPKLLEDNEIIVNKQL